MGNKTHSPISYYMGKANLAKRILEKIPPHELYVEEFFGSGAVFWAAQKAGKLATNKVVNDVDDRIITFWRVLKSDLAALKQLVDTTLHSEAQHRQAKEIYKNWKEHGDLEIAWAVWVQCNMSFASRPLGGFAYDRSLKARCPKTTQSKKLRLLALDDVFAQTTIFCRPATEVAKKYDRANAFHYLDPPYVNSNCGGMGHGWSEEHLRELLDWCENTEAKFLLSMYPHPLIDEYRKRNGWHYEEIRQAVGVDGRRKQRKEKVETFTWNY